LLPTAFLWFLAKVIAGVLWIARRIVALSRSKSPVKTPAKPADAGMTRRDFVTAAACAAPAVLTLGVTGASAIQWNEFRVRRLNIAIPNLPAPLDGLTIAQVSDLHVGVFTRGAILDRIVEASNQLQPDLVLLPGDLINYSLRDLPVGLDVVKRLHSRFGVFMCEGNHDLFEDPTAFRQGAAAAGVRLLVNDAATIPVRGVPIQVLGLRWGWGSDDARATSNRSDAAIAASMKELMTRKSPDAFPILLAHHPHAFDYAGDIPLVLAGHTHGGQLMLTNEIGFGPAMFRYWSGLYQKAGRALVVSNGVGNWFPLRVQAPAEIVHLTLRSA
jgi:predicted MPP superfamily phosphohydrolase